ncbi:histidine phosphatase family protein [Marispirochaeta aestuarii]|uniref:SixA phosphatase family protein n=1 Tax=Marispirochaeta aestuarii TaxID=1963862 RepID=UPI0029C84328|nr:histidine phosphatase family protein [Marispirochaeta aestuarii]
MLKTLLLLRHGKTHRGGYTRDWDRELKGRGVTQARHIGGYLKKTGLVPDRIITSSAVRARATAEICAEETEYPEPVDARDELYNIDDSSLIEFITGLDNSLDRVLLVGHNPAFEETASLLGGKSTPLGTGDCAVLRFALSSWEELRQRPSPESVEIIRGD